MSKTRLWHDGEGSARKPSGSRSSPGVGTGRVATHPDVHAKGTLVIFSTELLVQTVLSGLMVGVLYALMALGITFIYSIVKTINWAMGEFYMIGSYIQFVAVHFLLGPRWWWLAAAGVFVFGVYPASRAARLDPVAAMRAE